MRRENDEGGLTNVELPAGWVTAEFGSITTLKTGPFGSSLGKKDYVEKGIPLVNPMHIQNGRIVPKNSALVSPKTIQRLAEFRLVQGDVVLGRRGEMGRCAVVGESESGWLCGTGSLIVRTSSSLQPEFLQRFLSSPVVVAELIGASVGSTMVNLNQRILADLNVPLPPLAEQKRIADKLEAVLGRVDACRARLARVPALLKRFRQSVLASATSGGLTAEWRMTNGVNDEWEKETVGSIITKIEAGLNVQCEERPPRSDEKGLVKISAVTWGTYDDEKSKTLPTRLQVPESTRIGVGDFLISRANTLELVGACVIVHKTSRPVYLSDKILRLVMPEDMKRWLLMVLQSPSGRKQIESLATGNQLSMRNLAQANLRQIQVPKPTPAEQQEIVRRVEDLFAFADRIEARLAVAQKTVDRLTPSVLAKAFRGELVPQDPNDEPASALLERLSSQPAAKPTRAPRKIRK